MSEVVPHHIRDMAIANTQLPTHTPQFFTIARKGWKGYTHVHCMPGMRRYMYMYMCTVHAYMYMYFIALLTWQVTEGHLLNPENERV